MRRNMDLIRALILKLEDLDIEPGSLVMVLADEIESQFPVDDFTSAEILYHYHLIVEKGWADGGKYGLSHSGIHFRKLTSDGHDFADSVRDPQVWKATKEGALKAGGFSLDLLGQLAKGYLQKKIEQHTGISL